MNPRGQLRRQISRALAWLVPERNPSGSVFGLITVGALLAAESHIRESYADTVGSTAIVLLTYWLAHSYSDLLGGRLVVGERLGWEVTLRAFAKEWAIIKGATLPFVVLLIGWAAGAPQETAATAAVWTAAVALVAFELAAGVRAAAGPRQLALDGLVGVAIGLAIVGLRSVVA